jgi:signal transduction histidine kinase
MAESRDILLLLRKMAHDMRVPLNTLISTSDMLVEGMYDPLTTKQERAAVRVQRNSRRLLAMLDDFVMYVKADAGDLELNPEPFDPGNALNEWCNSIRAATEEKGLKIHLTIAESTPTSLTGDQALIGRSVQALLWNAVAYTAEGQITIESNYSSEQEWVIRVIDTGSGISDNERPHIFEAFWRGEDRPQTPTAGAGLGLPLARSLARLLSGDLILSDSSPQGSTFCLQIPLANA